MARTPKTSTNAHFRGREVGGSQTGFRTSWWQLNDGQNPENKQKCSFSWSQGWWQPENGCGHGSGGQTTVECLFSGFGGGSGGQRKVGTPKTSMKAHYQGWGHGGGGHTVVKVGRWWWWQSETRKRAQSSFSGLGKVSECKIQVIIKYIHFWGMGTTAPSPPCALILPSCRPPCCGIAWAMLVVLCKSVASI